MARSAHSSGSRARGGRRSARGAGARLVSPGRFGRLVAAGAQLVAAAARLVSPGGFGWLVGAGARLPLVGAGACVALVAALGCQAAAPPTDAEYPSLVLPAALPEGEVSRAPAARSGGAGSAAPGSAFGAPEAGPSGAASGDATGSERARRLREHGGLPDPEPLMERGQWEYPLLYDRGQIRVGEPTPMCLPRPQPTPRRIGRFAFELWVGHELVDRVRFDFPLLGSEEPPAGPRRPMREAPRFAPGARVSLTVRVPASGRAATARIVDRATGDAIDVAWPPRSPDGVARPHPCPPEKPRAAGATEQPPATDAGR